MGSPNASIHFTVVNDTVCVRIAGRANFSSSGDFKKLVLQMMEEGRKRFIIELSECVIMDSTFLGMLSGLGMNSGDPSMPPEQRPFELLNATERVTDLIDNLGVLDYFHIVRGEMPQEAQCDQRVEHEEISKQETARDCLAAHEVLMKINPENQAKFKDVVKYFAEEANRPDKGSDSA
jgi:anti-sigma B factor antagonist